MSMEHKCYCRGDEVTSLDLNKPEHLMPMMRPFSMRVSNLTAVLTNMLTCGLLTDYMYNGDGNCLVRVWRTVPLDQPVYVLRYGVECENSSDRFNKMPLQLTKPAPQFKTTAVVNGEFKDVSLSDYKGKYVVLFFYPLDFTFVCPTEIIAFSERADDFRKIGCEVIAASTDSHFTHLAWINTPRKQGGLGPMNIPIISDKSHRIARDYGVLDDETGIPFRGLFIIDDKQNLRQITVNDLPVGRSVEETLRLVQAFQYTDKYGEVCPANWQPGSKTIKPDTKAAKEYFGDAN
ncbi:peroxiredoxin 2 isoform X1 [Epargyreus clarus]|uniref:peroxiredoxin 2 isoform X1 n=1 Tax=Epargyreus clarus TaxID=520877 RepID=UPI003C2E76FF